MRPFLLVSFLVLLEHNGFLCGIEARSNHLDKVDTGGNGSALVVAAVPFQGVDAWIGRAVQQSSYFSTGDVVYLDGHRLSHRYTEPYLGRLVERIRHDILEHELYPFLLDILYLVSFT